jgi:hypothetical protein
MLFLNPLMLVGLTAAAVPLVLHLLSRARFREVEWGAMLFLDPAETRQVHQARLNQWLLLLIRMMLVAAVAVGLARPILQGQSRSPTETSNRITAAIVLDCSGSMTYDENGHTRFELAQSAAKQVLRGLHPGDRAALVLMGVHQPIDAIGPTADLSAVAARIDEQQPGYGSADVKEGLLNAADLIEHGQSGVGTGRAEDNGDRGPNTAGDIFVICDRQALGWRGIDAAFAQNWRERAAAADLRSYIIPVGGADADNVAVENLTVANPPIVRGQSVDAVASLAAFGSPRSGLRVSLQLDGRTVAERMVNLDTPTGSTSSPLGGARGRPQSVAFSFIAPTVGSHLLSAHVDTTGYTADNHYTIPLTVIDPIRVLLISGDAKNSAFGGAAEFGRWALEPHQAAGQQRAGSGDLFSLDVVNADDWTQPTLGKYQVAILADVQQFSPAQGRELEQFVYGGGGLLVAPGALSRVESYNDVLYRDGAGILPAQLHEATSPDGSDATSLLGFDLDSPVFAFLRNRPAAPSAAVIARYFPCEPRQSQSGAGVPWRQVDATVLARYLSGQPFLIEGSAERGRVLLLTTSLDADWTTLPLTNFYLPFVQSAVRYLTGPEPQRNLSAGQPIQMELPAASADDASVTLTRPDGQRLRLDLFGDPSRRMARYTDTSLPGVYTIDAPGIPPEYFVTHGSSDEADLTQLTPRQWESLESDLSARRIDDSTTPIPAAMAKERQGWELEPILLGVALVLGVLELVVSRSISGARGAGSFPLSLTVPERKVG